MEKIIGLINAPFTPFHADGSVNLAPIPAYAELLVRNGLKGVFINGSSDWPSTHRKSVLGA